MNDETQRGYTLLEVMISMLILAIAFLALIAVQLGALNGYVSARDNSEATELARRTAELLRIEGMQWKAGTFNAVSAYGGGDTPFDRTNPLADIGTDWTQLVDDPVDVRFNRTSLDADLVGGRFCIYAKGNAMEGAVSESARQYMIAVVYPGANADLNSCNDVTNAELDDIGSQTAPPGLELRGLRVVYYGTVVVRRTWADDGFGNGA